jgi:uncharacterized protein YbaA (DUF1428 family)
MSYVDGYLLPVPTKRLADYRRIAQKAGKLWREHGALSYVESAGDDLNTKWGVPFPKMVKAKRGETVIFAFITFKNRAARDRVNAKVMKDKRLQNMIDPNDPIFDMKRMLFGGFKAIVDL